VHTSPAAGPGGDPHQLLAHHATGRPHQHESP
jgi:hypothetical protein